MSGCCPTCGGFAPNPTQGPNNTVRLLPGPAGQTTLMRSPTDGLTLSPFRDCDLHTAMARGLAEYIAQQTIEIGGRKLRLRTFTTWAEPEANVTFPAAGISAGVGRYDKGFTPNTLESWPNDGTLMQFSEFSQELTMEVWATDPQERAYLAAMVEEAMNPVDWMQGTRLILPFYHGITATYEMTTSQFQDSADDSMKRWRRINYSITGSIAACRMLWFPKAEPRLRLDGVGPDVLVQNP